MSFSFQTPPAHFAIERLEFGGVTLKPPAGQARLAPSAVKNPAFSAKVVYDSSAFRGGRVIFEFDFNCEGGNNRVSEGPCLQWRRRPWEQTYIQQAAAVLSSLSLRSSLR